MKVLKRHQVTKVIVKRQISHDIELNGVKFNRTVFLTNEVPYMDCNVTIKETKPQWKVYITDNVLQVLIKSEVEELRLNSLFSVLDINEKNGNA